MRKRIELEVDDDLVQEVIRRYGVHGPREAVHLALKALLDQSESDKHEEDYDEFSDLSAWERRRSGDTG